MSLKVRLKEEQLSDLIAITKVPKDQFANIRSVIESSQGLIFSAQLTSALCKWLEPSLAEIFSRQLISIRSLAIRLETSVEEVLDAIGKSLEIQAKNVFESGWRDIREDFLVLIQAPNIRRVAMALALNYDYANLLHRTKILTDIRPIYDESAESVDACVVSFTLRISYSTADGQRELSIALDTKDVEQLASQCKRALTKANTAKSIMEKAGVLSAISGERE